MLQTLRNNLPSLKRSGTLMIRPSSPCKDILCMGLLLAVLVSGSIHEGFAQPGPQFGSLDQAGLPSNLIDLKPRRLSMGQISPAGSYFIWAAIKKPGVSHLNSQWKRYGPYTVTGGKRYVAYYEGDPWGISLADFLNAQYSSLKPAEVQINIENWHSEDTFFVINSAGGKVDSPVEETSHAPEKWKISQPPSSANIVGNWIFSMEYQGSNYAHDMSITSQNNDGSIKGNGGYPAGKAHAFDWTITTGSVTGGNLNFYSNYTRGAAGTTHVVGTISPDGSMSGTWTDNVNGERKGTWTARKAGGTPIPTSVNLVGNWIFSMEYQGSNYAHDMFITSQNNDGSIKGNGGYPAGKPHTFDWTITTGSVTGGNLNFYSNYTRGAAGATHVIGTISPDGSMSGTWTDNVNGERKGTWTARKSGN